MLNRYQKWADRLAGAWDLILAAAIVALIVGGWVMLEVLL